MGTKDKASNKAQSLKGVVEEKVGSATGNEDLQAKGKTNQMKSSLKDAGEKVKDAGEKVKDALRGK
jgi:uncharacterized protein YjbJ (UPF0337 family)